ncbi:MAG: transcriptional repressor, partial [Endomicrobiales bacterium]|nr:transcriptional repressor [Endomicrobiales bacterium]
YNRDMNNYNTTIESHQFAEKCEEHGLKVTPQRTVIYEELAKSKDHPTADMLYKRIRKRLPNISFDTVFRTLQTFSEKGITGVVEGYGEMKRYEPDMDNHHHARCIKCHKIIDFKNDKYASTISVPAKLKKMFKVLNKRVVLEGLCSDCAGK